MLDPAFARGQQVTGVAMVVGTIGGGFLGQINLSISYLLRSVLLALLFVAAYVVMHDVGFTPRRVPLERMPAEIARSTQAGVTFGWEQRPIRLLMLAATVQAGFVSWAFYASQPYLLELLNSSAVWIAGVVAAGIAVSMIAGNQVVNVASQYCGRRTTLLLGAVFIQAAAAIVMGVTSSFWVALPALLLITGGMGVTSPVRQAYIHQLVPTERRATVVSFDSMVSGAGGFGGQIGLGAIGEARSIGPAFIMGGLMTTLAVPFLAAARRIGSPADRIHGARGGVEFTCAAAGVPAVATVQPRADHELEHVAA
jgi:MFS family permease